MADDLVAELTLLVRSQGTEALDELKTDFSEVETSVAELYAPVAELAAELENMKAPAQLVESMEGLSADADELLEAWQNIGVQIDTDTGSIRNMSAELSAVLSQMADAQAAADSLAVTGGGRGGGGGGGVPPVLPPNPNPGDDDDDGHGHAHGGGDSMIGDIIAIVTGKEAFDSWNNYQQLATQIAVTEGLGPADAKKEEARLGALMDKTASQYGASSEDLLEAYDYLITDRVAKPDIETLLPRLAEASTAYNVPAKDIAQGAFTLLREFHVPTSDIGDSLAVLHHASMQGHFTMGDFGSYLPVVAGQAELMGMTGAKGNVQIASALEAIQEQTNEAGETKTELMNLLEYLHEPIATRAFDPTGKTISMLGAPDRRLLAKYHVPALDLPAYLDKTHDEGIDPLDAMVDFFDPILSKVKSPTDQAQIVGAYFHNQTAQQAFLALYQQQGIFRQMQASLGGVSDSTLGTDWYTATGGSSADSRVLNENLAQAGRGIGGAFDYMVAQPFNRLWGLGDSGGFGPDDTPDGRAPPAAPVNIPINLTVNVDKDGNVTAQATHAGTPGSTPAGTSTKVNQGSYLNTP